jgi:hypothetical protein
MLRQTGKRLGRAPRVPGGSRTHGRQPCNCGTRTAGRPWPDGGGWPRNPVTVRPLPILTTVRTVRIAREKHALSPVRAWRGFPAIIARKSSESLINIGLHPPPKSTKPVGLMGGRASSASTCRAASPEPAASEVACHRAALCYNKFSQTRPTGRSTRRGSRPWIAVESP